MAAQVCRIKKFWADAIHIAPMSAQWYYGKGFQGEEMAEFTLAEWDALNTGIILQAGKGPVVINIELQK